MLIVFNILISNHVKKTVNTRAICLIDVCNNSCSTETLLQKFSYLVSHRDFENIYVKPELIKNVKIFVFFQYKIL